MISDLVGEPCPQCGKLPGQLHRRGCTDEADRGPWHLVSRMTGRHHGPFTTEVDCVMARAVATPDWSTARALDRVAFEAWLARAVAQR